MKDGFKYLENLTRRIFFVLILIFAIFANFQGVLATTSHTENVSVGASVQYVPTKLVFLSSPQIVERGQYSAVITIQIQNEAGYPVPLTSDAYVNLASTSATGEFHDNNTDAGFYPMSLINQVKIAAGNSTATFYYRDVTAGNFNIFISRSGWTGASQPIVIQDTTPPNPPVVTSPTNGETFTTGNPTFSGTSDPNTIVLVTINGITYIATIDSNGNWNITWPDTLSNGSYDVTFVARDEYGNDSTAVVINININVPPAPTPTPTPAPTVIVQPFNLDIIVDNIVNTYNSAQTEIVKNVLINTDMTLVAQPSLVKPVKSVEGFLNGIKYEFVDANGDGKYEKKLTTPLVSGQYTLKIVITYEDGQVEEMEMIVLVDPYGYVYELDGDEQHRVRGVTVVLWVYRDGKWQIWDATNYNQINPQLTNETGEYAFIVPEGLYYITAEKEGYEPYKSHTMFVDEGNPININILMRKIGITGVIENIVQWFKDTAANVNIFLAPFVYSDFAKETYTPIATATAITIVLASMLLQLLNMSVMNPFGNIFARFLTLFGALPPRKKSWGVVYDAENNKPMPLAIVQIFDKEFGKLLETQTTDKDGRFGFLVKPGEYYIKVIKSGYHFPSKLQEQDYHGQIINVKDKAILTLNIPLDPDIKALTQRLINITKVYRVVNALRLVLLVVGTFYSFSFAVVQSGAINYALFGLYVIAWINEIYIRVASAKAFSKVYDIKDNDAIDLGIVRVFDPAGKIMATKVSDTAGNFAFLVGKGDYHLTITRENYEQFKSDPMHFHKGDIIKKKFGLKPRSA